MCEVQNGNLEYKENFLRGSNERFNGSVEDETQRRLCSGAGKLYFL